MLCSLQCAHDHHGALAKFFEDQRNAQNELIEATKAWRETLDIQNSHYEQGVLINPGRWLVLDPRPLKNNFFGNGDYKCTHFTFSGGASKFLLTHSTSWLSSIKFNGCTPLSISINYTDYPIPDGAYSAETGILTVLIPISYCAFTTVGVNVVDSPASDYHFLDVMGINTHHPLAAPVPFPMPEFFQIEFDMFPPFKKMMRAVCGQIAEM